MPDNNSDNSKTTIILQIITLLIVVFGSIFNHYSQKSLVEHKVNIERKEPMIFGTALHLFNIGGNIEKENLELTQVRVFDQETYLGDTVRLNGRLLNYPVLIAVRIENRGNSKADNLSIKVSSPANALMHGNLVVADIPYSDCQTSKKENKLRAVVNCSSLKRGEIRSFSFLWTPNFMSKEIENYQLKETTVGTINSEDLIEVEVVSDNGPKGIILEGSMHSMRSTKALNDVRNP